MTLFLTMTLTLSMTMTTHINKSTFHYIKNGDGLCNFYSYILYFVMLYDT